MYRVVSHISVNFSPHFLISASAAPGEKCRPTTSSSIRLTIAWSWPIFRSGPFAARFSRYFRSACSGLYRSTNS